MFSQDTLWKRMLEIRIKDNLKTTNIFYEHYDLCNLNLIFSLYPKALPEENLCLWMKIFMENTYRTFVYTLKWFWEEHTLGLTLSE